MINTENDGQDLQQLIKETELMQSKLELEVQYKKNMAFLKQHSPYNYERFVNFKPKHQRVFIDNDNGVSLINIGSRTHAYDQDAKEFSKIQVEKFIDFPKRFTMGFKPTTIVNKDHIHPTICNQALEEYSALNFKTRYNKKDPIGLMVMIGCGLGYQLQEIIKHYDIRNLLIYDENQDSFYASLFTIDWKEIITQLTERGGKVKLHIGENPAETIKNIRGLPYDIGIYNMMTTYVYMHTDSVENKSFYKQFKSVFHLYGAALGFFDDEQIAMAHTIDCINNNYPVLVNNHDDKDQSLPAAIIVGNGPSLDTLVDFIKQAKDHYIIISCGSALTSLYRLGITPDIHVELERNLTVAEMLKLGTSREYTKKIPLLALNNVSPATADLFKKCHIAVKPNDNGATILSKLIDKNLFFELPLCNPTVTNCGLSYAIKLGFKKIYLAGTDLGKKDKNIHHSKHSLWHDMDLSREQGNDKYKETLSDYTHSQSEMTTEGNFCETVTTTAILDSSRHNMEAIISENPDISIYNPNDGALIRGAISIKPDDIKVESSISLEDKEKSLHNVLKRNFKTFNFKKIDLQEAKTKYTTIFFRARKGLDLPKKCDNMLDLTDYCYKVFKNIRVIEAADDTTAMLVRGSLQVHMGLLYYFCSRAENEKDFEKCYSIGKKYYDRLLNEASDLLRNDPFRLDNTMLLKQLIY